MTENIQVNTALVENFGRRINECNNQIRNSFSSVDERMAQLYNSWESGVAQNAKSCYNGIKSCCEARYGVMDSYSRFLLQSVSVNYEQTEKAITACADSF